MESVKKEIIIAIILGIVIGGIATLSYTGILKKKYLNKISSFFFKPKTAMPSDVQIKPTQSPSITKKTKEKILEFDILPGEIFNKENLKIKIKTLPNHTVLLSSDIKDYISVADQKGNLSFEINLLEGENNLYFYLLEDYLEKSINIYYFPNEKTN